MAKEETPKEKPASADPKATAEKVRQEAMALLDTWFPEEEPGRANMLGAIEDILNNPVGD